MGKSRSGTSSKSYELCFAEILHEAEELWIRQGSDTSSEAGSSSTGGSDISDAISHRSHRSTSSASAAALAAALAKQNNLQHGHHVGPTIITVNGVSASINGSHNLDSMLYSMEEPRTNPNADNIFDEAIDLEPIDFEHFVDEPDLDSNSERVFKVSFGSSPPTRGR